MIIWSNKFPSHHKQFIFIQILDQILLRKLYINKGIRQKSEAGFYTEIQNNWKKNYTPLESLGPPLSFELCPDP